MTIIVLCFLESTIIKAQGIMVKLARTHDALISTPLTDTLWFTSMGQYVIC